MRPPWCAAARCRLRFQLRERVLLSPKDCARKWKSGSARNTLPGSTVWENDEAVCFRTKHSTARPDAGYYTSRPVPPHLRVFKIPSRRAVTVRIQARSREADHRPLEGGLSLNQWTAFPLTLPLPGSLPQSERRERARPERGRAGREWSDTAVHLRLTLLI